MSGKRILAATGHASIVELLLNNGADATAKTDLGWTAEVAAVRSGRSRVVEILRLAR